MAKRIKSIEVAQLNEPSKDQIAQCITGNTPAVFHGMIDAWPARSWTPQNLSSLFPDLETEFQFGEKRASSAIYWETTLQKTDFSFAEFDEFISGKEVKGLSVSQNWGYASYKHMSHVFVNHSEAFSAVDWSAFGFPDSGSKSTFWLGSAGATTQCHFDSYGTNLVAQIFGRKKWTLFPPSDTPYLYPTRIPFEESSVFSQVCLSAPDLTRHALFEAASPVVITLSPGQVLFVPRHWWHQVESVDDSISINQWIPHPTDADTQVNEALTRLLVSLCVHAHSLDTDLPMMHEMLSQWYNPSEDLCAADVSESLGLLRSVQRGSDKAILQAIAKVITSPQVIAEIRQELGSA